MCQRCHPVSKSNTQTRHSPQDHQHLDKEKLMTYMDVCGSDSSNKLYEQDRGENLNKSFGFDFEMEEKKTADQRRINLSEKEHYQATSRGELTPEQHRAVCRGEITPEGPETRVKKGNIGGDFRQSPLAGHGNTDASRHEQRFDNRRVRQPGHNDGIDSSHFLSPFQSHHVQGHHHGNTLRSDSYLRQALTSPYNQRDEKYSILKASPADSRSTSKEAHHYSPSLWREGMGQIHASPQLDWGKRGPCEGIRHEAGEVEHGHDHHHGFKTPRKSARSTPDGAEQDKVFSGNSSPSSASGSSSSGHHSSIHNPFEQGHDRLHFPIFSPSMFNVPQTPGSAEKETFQWNLEHIAELRPVHIDEKEIKRQLSRQCHDEEAEKQAQKAIDYYFQHHMVAPSPWAEAPPPHFLPVTPYGPGCDFMSTPNQAQGSIQKDLPRTRSLKKPVDKASQTTLTLPVDLALEKALGEYMTYQDEDPDDSNGRDSMSTSSLRRKLFFNPDCSSILSPVRSDHKPLDHLSAALSTPPPATGTPEWERGSPVHTPSSVQFSSSPIHGPLSAEGDCFRSSFAEHGLLSSPELSPIADRRRGRFRQALTFPSESSLTGEEDLRFGSPLRQPFQVEVFDGTSPRARPSPDVSPIAAFGSGGSGHHSRSRTLRADMSHSMFSSPQHASSHQHSSSRFSASPPIPLSLMLPDSAPRTQRTSVSMDTDSVDIFTLTEKEAGPLSPRDSSMTEETLGEAGSSGFDPDTLQHPSLASYPDTGYQTGSGNGSLQTTQEGGASMTTNTSTDAPSNLVDTGANLKKLAAKLRCGAGDHGTAFTATADEAKMTAGLLVDESSVDGIGTSVDAGSVAHSNLTNQFMKLPIHSELSADSADLSASLQSLRQAPGDLYSLGDLEGNNGGKGRHEDNFSSKSGQAASREMKGSDSVDPLEFDSLEQGRWDKEAPHSQRPFPSQSEEDFSENDAHMSHLGSYIYECDADFLNKMGEYLEKGGELSDDGFERVVENIAPAATTSSSTSSNTMRYADKGADDSVLKRAHEYLASVNYSQSGSNVADIVSRAMSANVDILSQPPKPVRSSTPTRRVLGKVAEDLAADRDNTGGPALGKNLSMKSLRRLLNCSARHTSGEVAKEILRRAKMTLKQADASNPKLGDS